MSHNNKKGIEEQDESLRDEQKVIKDECKCSEECGCGEECNCGEDHHCNENCHCEKNECENGCKCEDDGCDCDDKTEAHAECDCNEKASEYLDLARRLAADFENYRRHAEEDIKKARVDGQTSVIEVFLPCLDTFKEAKKTINDEAVLKGVEMIEQNIQNALKGLGVKKIDTVGQKYDPHLHNAIAVMKDEEKEDDIILEEYQAGYKFNDKVIRYAIVLVNKKEG